MFQSPDLAVSAVPGGLTGRTSLYASNPSTLHGDLFARLASPRCRATLVQVCASGKAQITKCHGNFTILGQTRNISFPVIVWIRELNNDAVNKPQTFQLLPDGSDYITCRPQLLAHPLTFSKCTESPGRVTY
jgi:hypothetical protein